MECVADGAEFDYRVYARGSENDPETVGLETVELDLGRFLGDQKALAERGDGAVELGFDSAIVLLGAWRQDLNEQDRVQEHVRLTVRELGLAADHGQVGVCILFSGLDQQAEIGRVPFAAPPAEA